MRIYYNIVCVCMLEHIKFSKTQNTQQRDDNQIDCEEELLPTLT